MPEDENGRPKDIHLPYLKCWLRGPSAAADVEGTASHALLGQYTLKFTPQDPGKYYLDAHFDDKPIYKKGDITIEISGHEPRVRPKINFTFEGLGFHSGRVGERAQFFIITKDERNNDTDIDVNTLEVNFKGPGGEGRANVHRDRPGRFASTFTVTAPGTYDVNVSYDTRQVISQKVFFSDVTRAEKSAILNVPMNQVRAKENLTLVIQSRDMFGNDVKTGNDHWSCTSTGTSSARVQITDRMDGTYAAVIHFPAPGVYHLDFRLKGEAASNSPLKITTV
jgi:hypothetical protein